MPIDRRTGSVRREPGGAVGSGPRVVILESETGARIEVLELGDDLSVGASFRHRGMTWTVTGERRASRVLYARLLPA